jgi:LacI family transcriptional regulator
MQHKAVTMRDVARVAGVHPGTVSRTLNPLTRSLVNERTAVAVERAARRLGYSPNPIARTLKTRRSFSIGVVVPDLTNPLFPPLIRGMESVWDGAGYTTLVVSTDGDPERERQRVEALMARQVDGFVIATASRHDEIVTEMMAAGQPVVLVNRTIQGNGAFAVVPDDRKGSALAVEHLAGLGHRRIAHLGGPRSLSTGQLRWRGFLEAMDEHGLQVDHGMVSTAESYSEVAGAAAAHRLLDQDPHPTAIVAGNDLLALGAYTAVAELGLRCPGDVSVVGFNDMPFADRFAPPLTTVHIPHAKIGARAAELLLERIDNESAIPQTLLFEPSLCVRGSTAAPS